MTDKLSQPQDRFFRETWSERTDAQSFLSHYLPDAVLQLIEDECLILHPVLIALKIRF